MYRRNGLISKSTRLYTVPKRWIILCTGQGTNLYPLNSAIGPGDAKSDTSLLSRDFSEIVVSRNMLMLIEYYRSSYAYPK